MNDLKNNKPSEAELKAVEIEEFLLLMDIVGIGGLAVVFMLLFLLGFFVLEWQSWEEVLSLLAGCFLAVGCFCLALVVASTTWLRK